MTPIDQRLLDFADAIDVHIEYRSLPADRDGQYVHARRVIYLRPGIHSRHHRSVLAHELAHALWGDVPSKFRPVNAKQERRAEEWAALRLIDLDTYRYLEGVHHGRAAGMAVELGVMKSIVLAYQGLLQRIGDTTYVDPQMGAGQWHERIEVA
ncbi:ImmA/IrrE family metallo-endopeptidase [Microbacterium sp. ANT_H45B]|uniref:ImmA/IrrE family metallo-endopeptidase n=1 Tax=Microbacterium sp. ANT_H45B TaxID=2597346 RepID=UPI0011EFA839|nr:ImmA/IrrE family metallo-endopeptidase [Microbacterium sp. ANT_H45B]KAA0961203.1 ImmA/IrrE family metallo-endopeptidase [Microbacterium sp. ANT_H45B]